MDEFMRQVNQQATETLRELFDAELLAEESPLLELIGLLLGDGFGEVHSPATVPITNQQWIDWHYLAYTTPKRLIATMNSVLERERRSLPRQRQAMRTWAASVLLSTLDQFEMM